MTFFVGDAGATVRCRIASLVIASAMPSLGCIAPKTLPEPAAPAPTEPASLKSTAPERAQGMATVAIDVEGETARAHEVVGVSNQPGSLVTRPLCESPCSTNVFLGRRYFVFESTTDASRVSFAEVDLKGDKYLLRHHLGHVKSHPAAQVPGVILFVLGGAGTLTATVPLVAGLEKSTDDPKRDDLLTSSAILFGASAGILGLGWLLLHLGRTEIEPGSTTLVPLSP